MTDAAPLVDERAARWAARVVTPARRVEPAEVARLRAAVAGDLPDLDRAARDWTGLGGDLPPTECRVVGRAGWVRANLVALRGAFDPLAERLEGRRRPAAKVLGVQVGTLLGLLSTKVLGQYVLPLSGPGTAGLVVVGPNVLGLADEVGGLAADIRRTVLLHELTHRLQFDAVPWLGEHLRGLLRQYLDTARIDRAALLDAAGQLPQAVARARETGSSAPLLQAVLTEGQFEVVERAQALMTLLEGHGNAVMYGAADGVIEDVDAVRETLQRRRTDVTTRVLTAVAGLEMKRRQYREGESFVRAVVDRAGVEGLNRAFEDPDNLPAPDEITEPGTWLDRVGAAA